MKRLLSAASLFCALFLNAAEWKTALCEDLGVNYYTPLSTRTFEYMLKCDAHFSTMQVPEFSARNLPGSGGIPGLRIDYVKNFNYFDPPMYKAVYTPETPLDLSNCRRMTGKLTTIVGHGYYSGRWYIELTDKNQKKVSFCIGKESWRFRDGWDFELPLTGFPRGFDCAHIATVTFTGYAPVHAHRGVVILENLAFDADAPMENENARAAAFQQAMADAPQLRLFPVAPETIIFPDSTGFTAPETPFPLRTAKGGCDDLQLVISPGKDPRQSLTVAATNFTSADGADIPAECIKFYELLFVPTLPPGYETTYEGHYPDILRPLTGNAAGTVPLYRNRITVLWVKVTVPRSAAAGTYSGKLLIGGQEVALTLTVDNFTMPERPTLRTSFWLFPNRIPRQNPDRPATFEDLRPWIDAALEAKMTPILTTENPEDEPFTITRQSDGTYTVDLSAWKNYYSYVMAHGGNAIHVADTHWFGRRLFNLPRTNGFTGESPEDLAKHDPAAIVPHRLQILQAYLQQARTFLAANQWQDFAYIQLWDEPNARARETILPLLYSTVFQQAPDIRLALTKSIPENLAAFVKMPIPSIPAIDNGFDNGRGYSANARRLGRSPWVYSCVSYGLTISEVPVRNRLLPLYCFAAKVDGYLFWALNYYNIDQVRNFPAQPWPVYRYTNGIKEGMGDGVMLYPPEPGNTEPMSSCRMQLWRSGMDDFEYLTELQRLFHEKEHLLSGDVRAAIMELLDISVFLNKSWEHPALPDLLRSKAGDAINYLQSLQ